MGTIHVLTAADLRAAVGLGADELSTVEAVYPLISERAGSMPPIMRIDVPEHHGEIDIKSAYLPGYDGIAVKLSSGFFDNPARGLPSLGGLMVLLDAPTGIPRAALFDGGYLTDLRTALAGAVAADHLAVRDATQVAVIGAGAQARWQVEALRLVRPIEHVSVWARSPRRAAAFAAELATSLGIRVRVAVSSAEAAAHAQVVVTTTPSTEPVLHVDGLHPGVHITAIGSDAEHKRELDTEVLAAADLVVVDHHGQSERLGELRAAVADGFDASGVIELGDVIAGRVAGRPSVDAVTVCDLTGTGAQDTAIATLAVARCLERGAGHRVET